MKNVICLTGRNSRNYALPCDGEAATTSENEKIHKVSWLNILESRMEQLRLILL